MAHALQSPVDLTDYLAFKDASPVRDVLMLCGIGLAGEHKVASDATLLVEVLSPSTSATDRREKLTAYRKLPGLRSYWIVGQDERRVELHARGDDGRWAMCVLTGGDDLLGATGVPGAPLRVADLYVGTDVA